MSEIAPLPQKSYYKEKGSNFLLVVQSTQGLAYLAE
jgi:hypothetical protein